MRFRFAKMRLTRPNNPSEFFLISNMRCNIQSTRNHFGLVHIGEIIDHKPSNGNGQKYHIIHRLSSVPVHAERYMPTGHAPVVHRLQLAPLKNEPWLQALMD
jgi:hypothetical protein